MHRAYALGPAEGGGEVEIGRTHPTPSDVVNTGTLGEILKIKYF